MTTIQLASAAVKEQLGLTGLAPSAWTYEQRVAYNTALADYIMAHPVEFTPAQQSIAQNVLGEQNLPLEDTGLLSDLSTFTDEFGNQAARVGGAVASVGEGAIATANLASWLLPVAAVAVVGILLYSLAKKEGAISA